MMIIMSYTSYHHFFTPLDVLKCGCALISQPTTSSVDTKSYLVEPVRIIITSLNKKKHITCTLNIELKNCYSLLWHKLVPEVGFYSQLSKNVQKLSDVYIPSKNSTINYWFNPQTKQTIVLFLTNQHKSVKRFLFPFECCYCYI